jgi:hypothetical protein
MTKSQDCNKSQESEPVFVYYLAKLFSPNIDVRRIHTNNHTS